MPNVFKCLYEVPAYFPEVVDHYAAVDAAQKECWEFTNKVGGLGFYTANGVGLMTGVVFDSEKLVGDMDATWKKVEHVYHAGTPKAYLCVPKRTKAATTVREEFEKVSRIPTGADLARTLGWHGKRVTDSRSLHWATDTRLLTPEVRVILQLPRQIGDGWEPPTTFTEITNGEYMAAIAAHNALVKES